MTRKFKDFDEFFAEQKEEPIVIKLFEKEYELPTSMPANILLKITRLQSEEGDDYDIPQSEIIQMAVDIFGEDNFEDMCEEGLKIHQLDSLISWVVSQYSNNEDDGEESDKKKSLKQTTKMKPSQKGKRK